MMRHGGLKEILESGRAPGVIGCLPTHSEARGCHPSQIKEFEADSIKMGVPTSFKDGIAHFENAAHLKRYDKAYGFTNIS